MAFQEKSSASFGPGGIQNRDLKIPVETLGQMAQSFAKNALGTNTTQMPKMGRPKPMW